MIKHDFSYNGQQMSERLIAQQMGILSNKLTIFETKEPRKISPKVIESRVYIIDSHFNVCG